MSVVGAGPGAADLITLRALERLQTADVVVFDRLVGPGVLQHVPACVGRIAVGKTVGSGGCSQAEINALLVAPGEAASVLCGSKAVTRSSLVAAVRKHSPWHMLGLHSSSCPASVLHLPLQPPPGYR